VPAHNNTTFYSNAATLKVKPFFTYQPRTQSDQIDTTIGLGVKNSNGSPYQWQYSSDGGASFTNASFGLYNDANGSYLSANNVSISITPQTASWNGYQWRCFSVSSFDNKTYYTNVATITLTTATITFAPQLVNQTVAVGGSVSFTRTFKIATGNVDKSVLIWTFYVNGNLVYMYSGSNPVTVPGGTI